MKSLRLEEHIYPAVLSGELIINDAGEIWRVAVRWRNRWSGEVRSMPCKARRAEHDAGKYLMIRVMFNAKRIQALAHRLVYRHFNGPIPEDLTVNHKNSMKKDNRPKNLELATYSEQLKHAYRIGLKDQHGECNPAATLSDHAIAAIRCAYAHGGTTMARLAHEYGSSLQHISRLIRGERRTWQGGPTSGHDHRHLASERDPLTGRFIAAKEGTIWEQQQA
jgi:hypothetical protein